MSTKSDSPETDAAYGDPDVSDYKLYQLARRLERERNELRARVAELEAMGDV